MLASLIRLPLGSRNYYRLARFLWIDARRDGANSMSENGEFVLLKSIVTAAGKLDEVVVCDIGANVGDYSKKLLDFAGATGLIKKLKLYLFEPNPSCLELIKSRFAHMTDSVVNVVPMIITNNSGSARFYVTGETAGTSSMRVDMRTQKATEIEASCITLDDYCRDQGITRLFFAKVDTEGNDMRVLEGAKGLLERGAIDFLQFEYNHRWILFRNYLKDVFDLVEPLGYQVAKVTPKGLEVYPRWHFELEVFWEGNYLIGKDFKPLKLPLLKSAIV